MDSFSYRNAFTFHFDALILFWRVKAVFEKERETTPCKNQDEHYYVSGLAFID